MLSPKLASRYAKSLMDLSVSLGKESEVVKDMQLLKETIANSRDLQMLLKSPIINADKKNGVVSQIFKGKLSETSSKFVQLLINKGREENLAEIVDAYIHQYNTNHQIVHATLTTAVAVDTKTVEKIKALILEDKNIKEVRLATKINPSIVGGFILQYDDKKLDNSVARKLHLIKQNIQDKTFISNL
ncbi:MAG: ATP synthase F1 subunit delta [Chitinophagales bacterium]|nr:ATP synthase F1 subunit delta [Chitinophagales bacterium]